MRVLVSTALGVLALTCAIVAVAVAGSPASPATHYLVRPDARMCPSPMCGGAWVRRVNHPVTRCVDGTSSRECYVAGARGVPAKLLSALAGNVLARGRIVPAGIEGFPELGRLEAVAAWRPAGPRAPAGATFRVLDTGVRCVTSPCFSLRAVAVEGGSARSLSDLDLAPARATASDLRRASRALATEGLLVTGVVRIAAQAGPAGDGRVLVARQIWLRP